MNEIAIPQHVQWGGTKYHGFIDMGTISDGDCFPVNKEAPTFVVVSNLRFG